MWEREREREPRMHERGAREGGRKMKWMEVDEPNIQKDDSVVTHTVQP